MAEEVKPDIEVSKDKESALDETKLAELIKSNVAGSVKEALDALRTSENTTTTPVVEPEEDFWDTIINPKVDAKTSNALISAAAAEDRAEFYSSDFWLEEVDEWLVNDDPVERKKEKASFKAEVEKTFQDLRKSGRPTNRDTISKYLLGEKISKDRIKLQESLTNRSKKRQEIDLDKAKRSVDIGSGSMANFTPQQINDMSVEKLQESFKDLVF